ncbi:MAG: HIT family protein [candidate division NC10 bacterium]|nr:HIT family protein [candidate division NC10 bacterium]
MSGCLFCEIAHGERPAHKVFEGEGAVAFLDIFPCTPGHTLVIPRQHYATLAEMPAEEAGRLFQTAVLVATKVQVAMGAAGFNLGINNGNAAGQEVFHAHIHIIPRYQGDGGGSMKSVARMQGKESLEQIATKLREAFTSL